MARAPRSPGAATPRSHADDAEDAAGPEETLTLTRRGRPDKEVPVTHQGVPEVQGRANSTPRVVVALTILLFAIGGSAVAGELLGEEDGGEGGGESEVEEFFGGFNGFGSLYVAAGTILLGWAFAGRWMLRPFGQTMRRYRIGIHTWTSIAALAMALAHTFGLLAMGETDGWASGTVSVVLMGALFVTGWWRTYWVRSWGLRTWRWVHWELALAAVLMGFLHWAAIEHMKELAA